MKELVAGFAAIIEGKLPNVKAHATYACAQGAYCVWEASNLEALENAFEQVAPTLKKYTEFVPVMQSYPPTMEYVLALAQQLIQAASK